MKPRTVAIELLPVGRRSFRPGPDGALDYGAIEPIDGARTCVVQRREAFASFSPFSPLDTPICVTTGSGEVVRLEGIPANSDLLITVEKERFLPATLTYRVEALDVAVPPAWGRVYTILLEPGQADPWLERAQAPASDAGQVVLGVVMVWGGPQTVAVSGNQLFATDGIVPVWAVAEGSHLTIEREPATADAPTELDTPAVRPLFLELSAGAYRVHVTHPRALRAHCERRVHALGPRHQRGQRPRDADPCRPRRLAHGRMLVRAEPGSQADQVLLDLPTCTFRDSTAAP